MTKEENIATLNEHLEHWKRLLSEKICDQDEGEKTIDALQNAIKVLEQQPTDAVDRVTIKEYLYSLGMGIKVTATDAVDRQEAINAAIEGADKWDGGYNNEREKCIREEIAKLPSVTPQPKMGSSSENQNKCGKWRHYEGMLYCSRCGAEFYDEIMEYTGDEVPKYCPQCGQPKMQEVEA